MVKTLPICPLCNQSRTQGCTHIMTLLLEQMNADERDRLVMARARRLRMFEARIS